MIRRCFAVASLSLSLALVAAGCAKEVTRGDPNADTHVDTEPGLFEVEEVANQMKNALANYHFTESVTARYEDRIPRCRLLTIKNETDNHFNTHILTDRVREILMDTGKIVFVADKERLGEMKESETYEQDSGDVNKNEQVRAGQGAGAILVLIGRMSNIRKSGDGVKENTIVFSLEIQNQERREALPGLTKTKNFRLSKS